MNEFEINKRIIVLKKGTLRQLNNPIPGGIKRRGLQGKIYSSSSKFINAKTLDDL